MKLKKTFFSIFMRIAIVATFLVSLCAILFSLSLNRVVALSYTVSTEAQLQEALESSVYDEIILSNSITLSNGTTIDGDLDGNGIKKTIRAEVTGTTSQGVVNEDASNYTLFYVSRNATVTIKNCNIKGGGITAIVNGEASNSTNNNSTLYIDNCSISNSGSTTSPGGGIRNTVASKVVLTNSSISRNIANYGAGFQNQQGTFIVDNCSISENRSFQFGGGGGENTGNDNKGGADAYMYIVNSTIANNTSQEIGGGINNCKNGYLYVINSVIAGNATTNLQYSGGGIGNNNSTLKCTNSILMDNVYLSATGGTTEQDVYEYSSGELSLDGCVYGSVTGSDQNLVNEVEVDSTCYQATSSDSVFASSKTGSIIDEDGHQGTNTYNQVVLVEDENGVTYAPLSSDSLANMTNNPSFSTVKVEFDYSDLNNIVLKTKDECSNETEAPTVCGAGKQLKSNEHILTLTLFVNKDFDLTGGTVYGDSYIVSENGNNTVTLKATPVKGKENKSVLWTQANVANETLTYLSSDNAYEINLSDSNLLNSCWDETKNSYNLIIQPITLNLSSEASDKSVRLSYSTDYSDTFCKNYSLTNNITSYDIYYSVVNDFESSSKQFFGNVTSTSTTITDLTNETTYYFYVVARIGNASFNGTIVGYTEETPTESGTKTYILVDALESGKEYLIVGRNTAGTGYALTNNNTNRATTTAVTVTTLDSTPIINVEANDSMLWTVTGSGTSYRISNGNRNIYLSSNTNITSTTSRNLTVTPTSIKYNNYSLQLTTATPSRYYGTRNVYFYEVKHKQDAPTTIEGSIQQRIGEDSGLITGVTNKMEYSTDGLSWNSISSTALENMPVGKYFFRYKETNLAYASAAVTVEILEKKLEQINIHTNPKLAYTAKDSLDLSGLVVTLIYNDGTSTDVTYNDFASLDSSIYQRKNGIIQTSISNGTILECSDNDSRITISLDGLETVTAKLSVSHHLVQVERKEATCTENGNEEYYICDSCGIMYSDSEGLNRIYVIPTIYATSHVWGSSVEENRVEPTCLEAGHYDLVMYCERCHEELQRQTIELSPLGHTWGSQVIENQVEPTCDTNGHYDLVIYCSVCGEELQRQTVTIEKLGHDYKNPVWVWDGFTAKYVYTCERDNNHKLELDADITSEITLAPTCLATGKRVYTATVEYQGNTYTDTKEEILPALGHTFDYNNPVWSWNDYSSAIVTFTCLNDIDHKDIYNATITSEVTEAPTCITTGVRTYTATVQANGKTYTNTKTEVIEALGHTEAEAVVENRVEPTCEVAGHYDLVIYCSVCGEELSRETIEIEAIGHEYGELIVEVPATCTTSGIKAHYHCERCNKYFDSNKNEVIYEELIIEALGHTEANAIEENRVEATCETPGSYDLVVYCSVCGEEISRETIEIPVLGHNFDYNNPAWSWNEYSSATVEFTCLNDIDHKDIYNATITSEVTEVSTCITTGVRTYTATVFVEGKIYTDTKTEVLPALGHTEANAVIENRVEATCATEGHYDLVVYCSVCGEELSRQTIEIPALGHNEGEAVVENRVEATCESNGHYDLVVYCSVCGEELSRETIEIPALGHNFDYNNPVWSWNDYSSAIVTFTCLNDIDHKDIYNATITSEVTEVSTCITTGVRTYTATVVVDGKTYTNTKTEVIEALGHTEAEAVVENRVEPTCEVAGHYDLVVYCTVCGLELSRQTIEIPALGHTEEIPVEENRVEATCESNGHYDLVVYCSVCGEEISRETIEIPALGHEYGELMPEVPATCTTSGVKTHYHCDRCNKYFDINKNEATYESLIIEALGHTAAKAVVENKVEATCETEGHYDLVVYCSRCGEELSRETIIIPALGHEYGELVAEVPATCTTTGIKAHYHCLECGKYFDSNKNEVTYEELIIEALGHTEANAVEENRVEATCTEAGHYDLVVYCQVCGEELSRETIIIPALGHTAAETVVENRVEPTCTKTGHYDSVVYCQVCGEEISRVTIEIPALGHTEEIPVEENRVEATCEMAGHYDLVVYCSVCGEEISRETIEIPVLGHNFDYNNPVWTWNEYSFATVEFTCLRDTNHKDIYNATITSEVTEAPTCITTGVRTYTATVVVDGKTYTNTKTEILTALGHAEAPAVVENKVDPTCTEAGHYDLVVYCQVCGEELSRETITVEALGHDYDYSNPVWSWNEYSSATVEFTCLNDADHKITYNAVIESEITVNPTCTVAGTKIYTATVIVNGNTYTNTKEETLNVLGHTEAETVVENRIEPTCETLGSYDLVVYCSVCGLELSRETIEIPALGHEYGELIPEVSATCTTTGIKAHYHCLECGKYFDSNKNEVTYEELIIEALGHAEANAVEENRVEATCTEAGHYDLVVYCQVCGEELSRETIEIPALGHDYDLNNPVWSWNEYSSATVTFTCLNDENHEDVHTAEITSEVTQAPTCEETGIRRYTAIVTLDGKTYTDTKNLVLPALGHTNAEAVVENKVDATCDVDGSYDLVVYCQVCGKELSRNTYIIPAFGHDYDYSDPEWTWDGYSSATVVFTCSHDEDHKISYNAIISIDSEVLPTCTKDGVRKLIATITVNGSTYTNTKTEVLPALGHTEAETVVENRIEPTCETSGSYDLVVYCSVCGEELSRETIEIEALGHNYDTHLWVWNGYDEATITFYCAHDNNHQVSYNATITSEITLAPTDSTAGEKTYTATVVVDGITYTNTKIEVLTKLHHAIITVHAKEATCDEDGNITYYYCPDCNIYYSDANLSVEINYEDTIIPALGHIYSDYIDEVLPTCTTNGMKAHYHCQRCNKYFDKDKNEVSYESLVIEALGHTLLPAVKKNEVLPTCEEDGHYDLVVYCSVCGEVVSRETIIIPALGHNYRDGVWYWNEYSSATLTYTCLNDSNHKLVYDATITSVVTIEPTDNTAGEKVYTATVVVDGITYTSQKVEELPKLHHAIITVYEKAATCTEDGNITYYYCPDCHIYYSDANLSNEITLEETIIHALGHNPSEAVVENRIEATCETTGSYDLVVYCSRCGEELSRETIEIPALGHEYGELIAQVPATCTTTGIKAHYHCLECGKYFDQDKNEVTYEELIIEALGHTEANTVEENRIEATCLEAGHYDLVVSCSRCGKELSRETITIPALGHTEGTPVEENRVEATCETAGSYDLVVYCQVCGKELSRETITIPAIGHDFDYDNPVWTWQGYESAQITFTCKHDSTHKSIHNATITSETTVEPTDNTSGLKVYTAVVEVLGITYKNQKQEELPKLHHAIITVHEKAATCEEDGNITYYYCPDCNIYYSDATLSNEITYEATIIPALGHNPSEAVVENKVEATCETTGSYDLVVYCSRCGKELSRETIVIPALGHEYGELIPEVLPTCTTTGVKAHYHCSECGKYFDQDKNEVTYEELIIEALGHTEGTPVEENRVEPTCLEAGHYDLVVYCQVCGEELSRETIEIPALGHTPLEAVEENRVEATCEVAGHYDLVVYCQVCGEELSKETIVIPAIGHDFDYDNPVWTWKDYESAQITFTCLNDLNHKDTYNATITSEITLAPTDTTTGTKEYMATVTVNGLTYTDTKVEELPVTAHIIEVVYAKAATCEEDGNITYYYCPDCNKYYSDTNLLNEITLEETIIHALGHNPSEAVVENKVEATCETEGHYDLVVYCSRCGEELSRETIEISALGHEYGELIAEVLPTCTTTGIKAHYHCEKCNKYFDSNKNKVTYEELIIEALGHTEAEAVVENRVEATCTEAGHYDLVVYCQVCGEELSRETIEIPALGHTPLDAVVENRVEATCEVAGHYDLVVYCSVCGEIISKETIEIEALGHEYDLDNPVWTWISYQSVTITFTCLHDANHKDVHNANISSEITIAPTDNASGMKKYTASITIYGHEYIDVRYEELPKNHHAITTVHAKDATCEENGNILYYYCAECDKYYSDANLSNEITLEETIILALGHNPSEAVVENKVEATCETLGHYDLVVYCSRCGKELSRKTIEIPALGHEYGELIAEVLATCTTTGIKAHYHCERCNKYFDSNKNEVTYEELIIEALGHAEAPAVVENRIEPTCTEAGHYDLVIYCQVCGKELSRETITIPALGHTEGTPVEENMVEATCETLGHYDLVVYCQVCGKELSREPIEIEAFGHDYDYSNPVWTWISYQAAKVRFTCKHNSEHTITYDAEITSLVTVLPTDSQSGLKVYTATVIIGSETFTSERKEELPKNHHNITVVYAKDATCDEDGNILYYYCAECDKYYLDGALKNEITLADTIIPKLGHTYGELIAMVEPTCSDDGMKEHYYCQVCGKYFDSNKNEVTYESLVIEALGHMPLEAVVENKIEAACETSGSYDLVIYCERCHHELSRETITIEALGHNYQNPVWHWNGFDFATLTFTCINEENHKDVYNASISSEITVMPTDSQSGLRVYTALVYAYGNTYTDTKEEALPKNHHTIVTIDGVPATCDTDGHITYYYCPDCNLYYSDAALSNIITLDDITIKAYGHKPSDAVVENNVEATCTTSGSYDLVIYCERCHHELSRETVIVDALGHDYIFVDEILPTCLETGVMAHYICNRCNKYFDINKNEVTYESLITNALGHEEASKVVENVIEATCTTSGSYDLVAYCSHCHIELSRERFVTNPLDHDYDYHHESWEWLSVSDAIISFSCLHDASHKISYHANVTSNVILAPTCLDDGILRYTATITINGVSYESIKDVAIAKTGHDYDYSNPVWNWLSYEEAKVSFTCLNDNHHQDIYDSIISSMITLEPTCEAIGYKEYTATVIVNGYTYTNKVIEELAALGHDYQFVDKLLPLCEETGLDSHYHCQRCDKYFDSNKNEVTYESLVIEALGHSDSDKVMENNILPTCLEFGSYDLVTYCMHCGIELNRETINVNPLGHDYSLIDTLEPTGDTKGFMEHYYCNRCHKYFDLDKNEVSYDSLVIPELGYTYTYIVRDKVFESYHGYKGDTLIIPKYPQTYEENEILYRFIGFDKEIPNELTEDITFVALYRMERIYLKEVVIDLPNELMIDSSYQVEVRKLEDSEEFKGYLSRYFSDYDLTQAYKIVVIKDEEEIDLANYNLTIKMKKKYLTELEDDSKLFVLNSNNEIEELDYTIEGQYIVFNTSAMSNFAFANSNSNVLYLVLIVQSLSLGMLVLILVIKKFVKR